MKCDEGNGYGGWKLYDKATNQQVAWVLWVDPEEKTYATMDTPPRVLSNGVMASTVHRVKDITVDVLACVFWFEKLAVTVAPLSRGRQGERQPSGKACSECRQEATCRRINYCAQYRCGFGEADKP